MPAFHNNKLKTVGLDDSDDQDYKFDNISTRSNTAMTHSKLKTATASAKNDTPSNGQGQRKTFSHQNMNVDKMMPAGYNDAYNTPLNTPVNYGFGDLLYTKDDNLALDANKAISSTSNAFLGTAQVPQLNGSSYDLQDYSGNSIFMNSSLDHATHDFLNDIPGSAYNLYPPYGTGTHNVGPVAGPLESSSMDYNTSAYLSRNHIGRLNDHSDVKQPLPGSSQATKDAPNHSQSIHIKKEANDNMDASVSHDSQEEYEETGWEGMDEEEEVVEENHNTDDDDEEGYAEEPRQRKRAVKIRKINKNGVPRKPRQPRPKLLRWSDNDWKNVTLGIVWACGEKSIQIPFEEAAQLVGENCTAGALQQALLKLRGKQIAEGYDIPALKMAWSRKGRGSIAAVSRKNTPASTPPKSMPPKGRSNHGQGKAALVVTLKRAYTESSRKHLSVPHMFRKLHRQELRIQTRRGAALGKNSLEAGVLPGGVADRPLILDSDDEQNEDAMESKTSLNVVNIVEPPNLVSNGLNDGLTALNANLNDASVHLAENLAYFGPEITYGLSGSGNSSAAFLTGSSQIHQNHFEAFGNGNISTPMASGLTSPRRIIELGSGNDAFNFYDYDITYIPPDYIPADAGFTDLSYSYNRFDDPISMNAQDGSDDGFHMITPATSSFNSSAGPSAESSPGPSAQVAANNTLMENPSTPEGYTFLVDWFEPASFDDGLFSQQASSVSSDQR